MNIHDSWIQHRHISLLFSKHGYFGLDIALGTSIRAAVLLKKYCNLKATDIISMAEDRLFQKRVRRTYGVRE